MRFRSMIKKAAITVSCFCLAFGMTACGVTKKTGIDESKGGEVVEGGEQYQEYVLSIMDTNFKNNTAKYMELTGSDAANAAAIYEASTQNLGLKIEEALSIKKDVVTMDLTTQVIEIAKNIYAQTQYEAVAVMKEDENYTVSLKITPIDFHATMDAKFDEVVNAWNEKAKAGELDNMTNSQYEQAYGEAVVGTLAPLSTAVVYEEPITVYITLENDSVSGICEISDSDMEALGQKVVDMTLE